MKTIHFVNYGQDCLSWDVDAAGVIQQCRPFDHPCFKGVRLLNSDTIEEEGFAKIEHRDPVTGHISTRHIVYPVESVEVKLQEVPCGP